MKGHPNAVAIHPYFRIHDGQHEEVAARLRAFVDAARSEPKCISYGFTRNGDELFCQEAYEDAEGVLAHLDNVGKQLQELLTLADMLRLEVHGPAEQLAKLRGPLATMNCSYFEWQCGL